MVAGHLREKKGYYYAVLNYTDSLGKRKTKWISTGLTVKGNKKRAEKPITSLLTRWLFDLHASFCDLLFGNTVPKCSQSVDVHCSKLWIYRCGCDKKRL